ncbi:unnamed protein product [Ectocarpus sp. 12 AP-2014]
MEPGSLSGEGTGERCFFGQQHRTRLVLLFSTFLLSNETRTRFICTLCIRRGIPRSVLSVHTERALVPLPPNLTHVLSFPRFSPLTQTVHFEFNVGIQELNEETTRSLQHLTPSRQSIFLSAQLNKISGVLCTTGVTNQQILEPSQPPLTTTNEAARVVPVVVLSSCGLAWERGHLSMNHRSPLSPARYTRHDLATYFVMRDHHLSTTIDTTTLGNSSLVQPSSS